MCTRYVLLEEHYRAVLARLGIAPPAATLASRYNIAPGTTLPAVRVPRASSRPEPAGLHWGLIPPWAKTSQDRLVNVRAETLAAKPYFQRALAQRRCILPASGFYEWQPVGGAKQPWLFRWRDDAPLALAAIWAEAKTPDGSMVETCAVITTTPNEIVRPIHDRMPVMLSLDQCAEWLDPSRADAGLLTPMLQPPAAERLSAITVDPRMNNARFDDPACIAPAAPLARPGQTQLSFEL